jgi:preprotein translocase subunit SecF
MSRSLNTSITLLLTVTAMLLLGGDTIRAFLLTILVGVIAGTYSSIGIAAQLLVSWEEGDIGRWLRLGRGGGGTPPEVAEQA